MEEGHFTVHLKDWENIFLKITLRTEEEPLDRISIYEFAEDKYT